MVVENPWISELYNLRGDLGNIEGIWERMDESDLPCERVYAGASPLAERFHTIEDKNLDKDLGAIIEKYRYAQYAYLMASDVECDENKAQEYAQNSIQDGEIALAFVEEAEQLPGDYGQALRNWFNSDFTADRIYFHNALGYALLHRLNIPEQAENVMENLEKIRNQYYAESGVSLKGNRLLRPMISSSSAESEDLDASHPCNRMCGIQ